MGKGILGDREKALENSYFRKQDEALLEQLRTDARIDDIARAVAEKLQVDNPVLLLKARELGIDSGTAPAFLLAPLVQVAWASGSVSRSESHTVLRLAGERGIEEGSAAHAQLVEWMRVRPPDDLFNAAVEVIKYGLDVLPPEEKEERISRIVKSCEEVVAAGGGQLGRLLGLGSGISEEEESVLDLITQTLHSRPDSSQPPA